MNLYFNGVLLGIIVFAIIGIFHPLVIKAEYYWGTKSWWIFFSAGLMACFASLFIQNLFVSAIFGVVGFTCFWSIKEVFEQEKRVQKGQFPKNPKRNDKF
jgi:hypothetical protein